MKKQIIVPIDDSIHSHQALKYACTVATESNADIILVNVQPSYDSSPNFHQFVSKAEIQAYIQETGDGILEKAIKTITNQEIHTEKVIRTGIPKVEITNLAKERNAACIIMGTRGLGAVKSAFIGSVSLGVLQLAPCPVTLVP
ncbi:universal stress protein [Bacillus tuaregi]|uniref:universal stress protein n=1 Tax=Bacillus tuaregi TaxID=1816695 RepID=UPI0008F9268B|nr:universal stress protein [Bacillus tuaregi]